MIKKYGIYIFLFLLIFLSSCKFKGATSIPNKTNLPPTMTLAIETKSTPTQTQFVSSTSILIPSSTTYSTDNYRQNQFVWFYKPPEYDAQIKYLSENYSYFILTKNDEWMRNELEDRGILQQFPQYFLANAIAITSNCQERPWQNQVAFQPGDYCWIFKNHPEWFLLDNKGKFITDTGDIYMDPGNLEWQIYYIEKIRQSQDEFGWQGVFLDNLDGGIERFSSENIKLLNYPNHAAYIQANISFIKKIYTEYFQPNQVPLFANITYLSKDSIWFDYLTYLDGAMMENWGVDWGQGYLQKNKWEAKIRIAQETQKQDKLIFLVAQGQQNDIDRQQFSYASYLLISQTLAYYRYSNNENYNEVWDFEIYHTMLGAPISEAYKNGNQWVREFKNGKVIVNPVERSSQIIINE